MSGVESGHAFGVPVVLENLVGLKALTIVLSYRNHIVIYGSAMFGNAVIDIFAYFWPNQKV